VELTGKIKVSGGHLCYSNIFLLFGIINSSDGAKAQRTSEEQQVQEDKEKNNDDKNDNQNKGDTPLEFKVPIPFP
jgi:hypothetical protein